MPSSQKLVRPRTKKLNDSGKSVIGKELDLQPAQPARKVTPLVSQVPAVKPTRPSRLRRKLAR